MIGEKKYCDQNEKLLRPEGKIVETEEKKCCDRRAKMLVVSSRSADPFDSSIPTDALGSKQFSY